MRKTEPSPRPHRLIAAAAAVALVAAVGAMPHRATAEPNVTAPAEFKPYTEALPGTDVTFEMVPIPGGELTMGSSAAEQKRFAVDYHDSSDEGPQVKVRIEPFWMMKHEVTWAQFKQYMKLYDHFKRFDSVRQMLAPRKVEDFGEGAEAKAKHEAHLKLQAELRALLEEHEALRQYLDQPVTDADAITTPTPLYDASFTYDKGEQPNHPAVTMTPHTASQYAKWLSRITGRFYRLPTEAEWEWACRAGATTAYAFGDDMQQLGDYAWYFDNSEDKYHPVGQKKPNAWGLHDMHGNVAEWVLDEYDAKAYAAHAGKTISAAEAWRKPTKPTGRVFRGGSWDHDPQRLRSAAREASDDKPWKLQDPNEPRSPWWYTEVAAQRVGFRLVRPVHEPTEAQQQAYWREYVEQVRSDVDWRVQDGRGARNNATTALPKVIGEAEAASAQIETLLAPDKAQQTE